MTNDFEGKLIADKYRLGDLLRESDSGDLYTGRHEYMDKAVTIKILPQALAMDVRWSKRFLDGAKNAATLNHSNILNVIDFGTDSRGGVYSVFESASNETLKSVIAREGSLDVDRILNIAKQTATAVAAAHAKNVIHTGLTPADIFLVKNENGTETAKVCGFGGDTLSVPRDADPRYLSPEQSGEYPVASPRSDIYSLGVIIYEMLAGVAPVEGNTSAEVKLKREQEPPPPLSAFRRDLPEDLEPMILSALALDPERRYPTMAAFAEDLELLSGGAATPAVTAATPPKKNAWQAAFIVLAGISLLAVGLIYATYVRKTDPTTQLVADAGSLPVQPIGPATGAQEESLAKLPEMTEAEIMAASTANMALPPGTLPGGDGYNAWANGGAPPIGAPLPMQPQPNGLPPQAYIPPGQTVTIDPNNGSQFMPSEGGIILVPVPRDANTAVKPSPTPKTPSGNTAIQPSSTPKPMATPIPKNNKPATTTPGKDKTTTVTKPATGKPGEV